MFFRFYPNLLRSLEYYHDVLSSILAMRFWLPLAGAKRKVLCCNPNITLSFFICAMNWAVVRFLPWDFDCLYWAKHKMLCCNPYITWSFSICPMNWAESKMCMGVSDKKQWFWVISQNELYSFYCLVISLDLHQWHQSLPRDWSWTK